MFSTKRLAGLSLIGAAASLATPAAFAGAHTWDVWEVFSNADGTVQFVELHETNGGNFETGIAGHIMSSSPSGGTYTIHNSLPQTTGLKYYLLATSAFAALPGAPTPNEILPNGFISSASDISVTYTPYDTATWAAGALPADGIHSLTRTSVGSALTSAVNSPTNYAGTVGSVDASGGGGNGALAGVPDGTTGTPLRADRLVADGSSISVSWDTATCSGELDHQILYGQRSGFPAAPGGNFTLLGGTCNIGATSPSTWTTTPAASDGSGLVWFLVVTENNAGKEGSWGTYNGVAERNGPGTGGASNVCGVTNRDVTNVCGH